MRVYAFRGTHYDAGRIDVERAAAPPYDQIGRELRRRLHAVDHQFAHLTLPTREPAGGVAAGPAGAVERHRRWLDGGLLRRDAEAALYLYEIRSPDGTRRLGLCCLLGLEAPGSGVIRPHELTVAKTVAERLDHLRTTRIDMEPILVLSDDGGTLDEMLSEDLEGPPALGRHRDAAGHEHRLFRLEERGRIARYRDLLAGTSAVIADGHHRYEVARRFAAEVGAGPGSAPATKLAVVTSLASPGLTIDPIHRGLRSAPDLATVDGRVGRRPCAAASGAELAAAVAAARRPSVGLYAAGATSEIWSLAEAGADAAEPALVPLHDRIFPALGLDPEAATDGTVLYRSDPDALFEEIARGDLAAGFWLPPMTPQEFSAAVAGGRVLPPKSTRFLPKLASGLVWAEHAAAL